MTFLRVLLAILWIPLGMHCELETLGLMPAVLVCDTAADEHAAAPSQGEADGCCSFESAAYFAGKSATAPALCPTVLISLLLAPPVVECPLPVSPADPSALVLKAGWQFFHRAAAPPRAPSFVS